MLTLLSFAVGANAQTVVESKTFDNFYVGINGGAEVKTTQVATFENIRPTVGVRVGRNFTPVFGVAVDGQFYLDNADGKPWTDIKTAFSGVNVSILPTINLSNWFFGYKGEPRTFEVSTITGIGYAFLFGNPTDIYGFEARNKFFTSKLGLDLAFNLGKQKAWQIYIEPSITYALNPGNFDNAKFNINNSCLNLSAGIIYKFNNSNGTHNFKIAELRDQAEIDALNSQINQLRETNNAQTKTIDAQGRLIEQLKAKPVYTAGVAQKVTVIGKQFVTFAQNSPILTEDAKEALDAIPEGTKVNIEGFASPEGASAYNQALSERRAAAVADYLTKRGVIVNSYTGKGVQGAASNRLAVITIE